MKATTQTRRAAHLVEVVYHGQGVTYKCLKCGLTTEANAHHGADHKEMIRHADRCVGTTKEEPMIKQETALQQYGERDTLSEMVYRIKNCVPGGTRLQDAELRALAQVAMSTGLNPFTGEIWLIPGKGPMAGIKGLRRRAREQSTYSITLRAMRNSEPEDHNLKLGDVGRICELYRHDILAKAVEINRAAGEMVIPVKPILGVGIWRIDAGKGKPDPIAATKSAMWMADKRAEADALRKGFDLTELQYSDEVNGSQIDFAETAGGWSVAPEEDEVVSREVARMAERHAEAFDASLPMPMAHNAERHAKVNEVLTATTSNLNDAIAKYQDSESELPTWVEEIRASVAAHPQASDPVGGNGSFVRQLEISAGRKISVERFHAFVQIVLGHPLADITFGEASVLMDTINADDFEVKVASLF